MADNNLLNAYKNINNRHMQQIKGTGGNSKTTYNPQPQQPQQQLDKNGLPIYSKNDPLQNAYKNYQANGTGGLQSSDKYKALVNQNTSALSMLQQAQRNAQKYAQTTAQAQGYASQGMLQQQQTDLSNIYMNQVANQNQSFMENITGLENSESANAFNSYSDGIATLISEDKLNNETLKQLQDIYYPRMTQNQVDEANYLTNMNMSDSVANTPTTPNTTSFKANDTNNATQSKVDYTITLKDGGNFASDTRKIIMNKNFMFKVGNSAYEIEFGNSNISAYLGITPSQENKWKALHSETISRMKVGEYIVADFGKKKMLLVKHANGYLYPIEHAGRSRSDADNLIKALGLENEGIWLP